MKVTKYLRKALAAQSSQSIELNNDSLLITDMNHIATGEGFEDYYEKLLKESEKHRSDKELPKREFEILIALKNLLSPYEEGVSDSQKPRELTCVFFVPAKLCEGGILAKNEGKLPWFVREYMEPMIEAELSIGKAEDVDDFLSQTAAERRKIESWNDYWDYICLMYQTVTHEDISSLAVPNDAVLKFDKRCYIKNDTTVVASQHILKLYDAILAQPSIDELLLYRRFTALGEATGRPLTDDPLKAMLNHSGQMGNRYPLAESQRESLDHLNLLADGEILAVSGPPGTGKTTLLQSVVADCVTKRALMKAEAPIIVASSTNNQAVTNIIDSFSQPRSTDPSGLELRWVTAADSLATYFPSSSKKGQSKKYQIDTDMINTINQADVRKESREKMLCCCEAFFGHYLTDIAECRDAVYHELTKSESLKCRFLNKHADIMRATNGLFVKDYLYQNAQEIHAIENKKQEIDALRAAALNKRQSLCLRMEEWEKSFQSQVSWYIRMFGFVPSFNRKIIRWTQAFKTESEITEASSAQTTKDMLAFYQNRIQATDSRIKELQEKSLNFDVQIKGLNDRAKETESLLNEAVMIGNEIIEASGCVHPKKDGKEVPINAFISESTTKEINEYLDVSLRWRSFWLAIHYYECVWLEEEPIKETDIWKTTYPVFTKKYRQLSMLSPCFVMTFYMLPSKMKMYNDRYLMNYIDLLIVDEAGQTSPEVAAASFALAKKAIVVGDEFQIPPVWGLCRQLDIALALDCGVIQQEKDFSLLEKRGLNASQSSVMKLALGACPYSKAYKGNTYKGLFLSEHRRCYDEIIRYCNDLVYQNRLEPKRGSGLKDTKRPEKMKQYPIIGCHDIPTPNSEKVGSSRKNVKEAKEIALWIATHFGELCDAYGNTDKNIRKEDIIAVITPFKAQANEIRTQLRKAFAFQTVPVTVGTVHTFQGAERNIIIFSTTYGANESGFFIDNHTELMNVAVSRAKDAFWVFGSFDCLQNGSSASAKGLLCRYVQDNRF